MLRVLIVDDEAPARDELRYLLSMEAGVTVVGEADNAPAALGMAMTLKPQIVFLDVEMRGGMNGCDAAVALNQIVPDAIIVFATAYDDYAVKAFEIGAADYILKPFEGERVHTTLERLKRHFSAVSEPCGDGTVKICVQKLPVEKNGKIMLINYNNIIYAYSQAGSVTVVTDQGEFAYNGTMAELEERWRGSGLVRVHKSYIVNLEKVQEVIPWFKGTYWLKVSGRPDAEIPVSKGQIKEIKDMLGLK